jgi:putative phosphotransacetylase
MANIFGEQINTIDFQDETNPFLIPIGVSNRHLHISEKDFETIFGAGRTLTSIKDLSQPGQFACEETVHVVGPKGMIENMRILGPFRGQTQIEVSQTDARKLGIQPPLRHSGDLAGTPGCVLVGP